MTPSAWVGGYKAFQMMGGGFASDSPAELRVVNNAYYNGTDWLYTSSYGASNYRQTQGAHEWYTAASGTVGAIIGFGNPRMKLDVNGNLGLGVTPSAWGSNYKAIDITASASFVGSGGTSAFVANNAYNDGSTWRYKTSTASIGTQLFGLNPNGSGGYAFFTAPSGTAGNAITFTQAMTLDASGDLLLGTTSQLQGAASRLCIAGDFYNANGVSLKTTNGGSGSQFIGFINESGTLIGSVNRVTTTNAVSYNTSSDYRLKNITGPITTSGAYIDSLNPVEGTWKADGSAFVGLIAHEVQEASRTTVATGTKDGADMQGMDYSSAEIIANLIAEIQSLRARVAALEAA